MGMNVLATIRRIIWGIILGSCITVALLYLAFYQTFLSGDGLHKIVSKSQAAQTVRDEFLLPTIIEGVKASPYASFFDDATITKAFKEAVSVETLNDKMAPAIDSLQAWLNSKEPSINFSIDTSDMSASFIEKLAQAADKKFTTLPQCTRYNTLIDAENGICQSPLVSKDELKAAITRTIENEPSLRTSLITQETIILPSSAQRVGHSLPDYLNIFYGLSIIAGGVSLLVLLWLLLKHRLQGIMTIGFGCLLAAILLFGAATTLPLAMPSFESDQLINNLTLGAVRLFTDTLRQYALVVGGVGFIIGVISSITLVFINRRRKPAGAIHLHSDHRNK